MYYLYNEQRLDVLYKCGCQRASNLFPFQGIVLPQAGPQPQAAVQAPNQAELEEEGEADAEEAQLQGRYASDFPLEQQGTRNLYCYKGELFPQRQLQEPEPNAQIRAMRTEGIK